MPRTCLMFRWDVLEGYGGIDGGVILDAALRHSPCARRVLQHPFHNTVLCFYPLYLPIARKTCSVVAIELTVTS